MGSAKPKKPGIFRRALLHQYNLILLAGAGLFALATFSWVPLLIGAGAEALWLTLGADSQAFRRWSALQEGMERQQALDAKATDAMHSLEPSYTARIETLRRLADETQQLATENPSLETQLVQAEMDKLGRLIDTFIQMAVVHQRLHHYLGQGYDMEIQRDLDRCRQALAAEKDPEVQATLRQSMVLAEKRLKQHVGIEATFRNISVKMDTLEKSFSYLKSHVIAVGTQDELKKEIDDLIVGVETVEDLTAETDGVMVDLSRARAAAAARQGVK